MNDIVRQALKLAHENEEVRLYMRKQLSMLPPERAGRPVGSGNWEASLLSLCREKGRFVTPEEVLVRYNRLAGYNSSLFSGQSSLRHLSNLGRIIRDRATEAYWHPAADNAL